MEIEKIENELMDMGKGSLAEMVTNLTKANIALSKEVVSLREKMTAPSEIQRLNICPSCGSDYCTNYSGYEILGLFNVNSNVENMITFTVTYYCETCSDNEDNTKWEILGYVIPKSWKIVEGYNHERHLE